VYICICNALKDRQLAEAANDCNSVADVFKKCGTRPQCGKCLNDVADLIDNARAAQGEMVLAAE